MSDSSQDIKTTVSIRVLFKLAGFVTAVLAAISGPSLYVANAYSNQQWVSRVEFKALAKKVDDGDTRNGKLLRRMDIMLCEQRHGKDAWDLHADKCSVDLGINQE